MGEVLAFTPPPLAPRDPRFIPGPVELCALAGVWKPAPPSAEYDPPSAGWDAEEKVDGIRCLWIDGQLMTREGEGLDIPHVAAELKRLERRFGERMMFDGEYQEAGGFLDTLSWLQSRGRREAAGTFHLFDAVPIDEWRRDGCDAPLGERRASIGLAMRDWSPAHVRRAVATPVATRADVDQLAGEVWARGGEGLMLKDSASLYRRARIGAWLKVKRELRLTGPIMEMPKPGVAVVEIGGRRVRVKLSLSYPLTVGMHVAVAAMEWTARGQLRHGRIVGLSA